MKFDGFEIHASPFLADAFCECGNRLSEVSNGCISSALYCVKCESVYVITKRRLPKNKITREFLQQCRFEMEVKKAESETVKTLREKFKL